MLQEIAASPRDLQVYLAEAARSLLAESRFLDLLPGFVLDSDRVPMIQERLGLIAAGVPGSAPGNAEPDCSAGGRSEARLPSENLARCPFPGTYPLGQLTRQGE